MKKYLLLLLALSLATAFGAAAEITDEAKVPAVEAELEKACGGLTEDPSASRWIPTDELFLTAMGGGNTPIPCSTVEDCPCPNTPTQGGAGCFCTLARICICNYECAMGGG